MIRGKYKCNECGEITENISYKYYEDHLGNEEFIAWCPYCKSENIELEEEEEKEWLKCDRS